MDKVARFSATQRRELFSEAAVRLGMTPAVVEKDFWVTWVLDRLFAAPDLARLLMFKGGTSLSKAYGLIERFSEDIDLILDWRVLVGDDPLAERSKKRQLELNEAINQQAQAYIAGPLLAGLANALGGLCQCRIGEDDPHVIEVRYPAAFADTYLRPEVRLEIGPLADVVAFKQRFYPRGWARYDLAVPGSLRLLPDEAVLAAVEADYRAMADMIFGRIPDFADIVAQLRALEEEINRSSHGEHRPS